MSRFDRIDPITQKPKGAFDQVLTSWFLDAPAKNVLSKHFLASCSYPLLLAKIQAGIWEHEQDLYLPVFYRGMIPSLQCKEVFLSFRKMKNDKWRYGYVLIKEREEQETLNLSLLDGLTGIPG